MCSNTISHLYICWKITYYLLEVTKERKDILYVNE
nr:MAG TPA: hypothetical protein [Caudoviricetes sp.]